MEIKVKIIPYSSQATVIPQANGDLKIKVKSAPVAGQANKELIKLLAKYYQVTQNQITILRGQAAKNKLVKINN